MSDNNGEPNLELLNQQIWELRRSVESATALIGGLLIMILAVLILQSWQVLVGVFFWCRATCLTFNYHDCREAGIHAST